MAKYLDSTGLTYLWAKIKSHVSGYVKLANGKITIGENEITPLTEHQDISGKVDKTTTVNGHALSSNVTVTASDVGLGNLTNEEQIPLSAIGAAYGVPGLDMDKKIDERYFPTHYENTIEGVLVNGTRLTVNEMDVDIPLASASADGAMSSEDKQKLDDLSVAAGNVHSITSSEWAGATKKLDNGFYIFSDTGGTLTVTGDCAYKKSDSGIEAFHWDAKTNKYVSNDLLGNATTDASNDSFKVKYPISGNDEITVNFKMADANIAGMMSAADKTKLDGIATGAEVNQNAFGKIYTGGDKTTTTALSKTDTISFLGNFYRYIVGSQSGIELFCNKSNATEWNGKVITDIVGVDYTEDYWRHGGDTSLVTVGFIHGLVSNNILAVVNSPAFTGTPTAPTAAAGTNTTQIATTAYVTTAVSNASSGINDKIGAANGICPLDANTKIDSQYLPSYVDDVIEAYARSGQTALTSTWLATGSASGTVITPEAGKIYVLMADSGDYAANSQFRWGGSAYVKLNDGGVSAITTAEIDAIVAN